MGVTTALPLFTVGEGWITAGELVPGDVDLSRFSSAPVAHLSGDPFECQGTFPA